MARGLTLIELLVVVAILATVAGTVLVSQEGVEDRALRDITRTELQRVREAVLRFRADTGFLPKQGPYALRIETAGGEVEVPVGIDSDDYRAWFNSPANLSQLYENPLAQNPTHPSAVSTLDRAWDPDLARGWNGPYLGAQGQSVSVGDGMAADGSSGTGVEGTRRLVVPGLADRYEFVPIHDSLGTVFSWSTSAGDLDRAGRPYFLFSLDSETEARVVSCGPNGVYAPRTLGAPAPVGDDSGGSTSDDLGVFLLR
jgi:prepilin-type N-terminal cleavage/methylation domain-containing protein